MFTMAKKQTKNEKTTKVMTKAELEGHTVKELRVICKDINIDAPKKKDDIINAILKEQEPDKKDEPKEPKNEDEPEKNEEEPKEDKNIKRLDQKIKDVMKPWETVIVKDDKEQIVRAITFLGDKIPYEPMMKHRYKFPNLKQKDGLTRIITGRFPKSDNPTDSQKFEYMGYEVRVDKHGNSAVCFMYKDDKPILEYVSLNTVIDVLQDELNGESCDVTWGMIDQSIKYKRGLKSRYKALGSDDMPISRKELKQLNEQKKDEQNEPKKDEQDELKKDEQDEPKKDEPKKDEQKVK